MGLQTKVNARNNGEQNIQYFRKHVTFDGSAGMAYNANPDNLGAGVLILGIIPAGSTILASASGVDVNTVFNAGTNNRFQYGIAGTVSKYGLNLSGLTIGFVPAAVAVGHRVAVDTTVIVTNDITGTAPTTGDVDHVLAFINSN